MKFIAPRLVVKEQIVEDGDVVTILEGSPAPYESPLAPAGFYDVQTERVERFQLHKVLHHATNHLVFKTFGSSLPSRPITTQTFVFRPWWTDEAWELVTTTSLVWQRLKYPANGSHEHCAITWEAIGCGEQNTEGYRTGSTWVTVQAYEKFVRDDAFHCRSNG